MSKLLFDRPPLIVDPELACLIGLHEAIILQQVHYWLEVNQESARNIKDGHVWAYNSYEGWGLQFPFWSIETIKRTITSLEKKGLLITGNYNTLKIDRTKWYRIDYGALKSLEIVSGNGRVKMTSPSGQNDPMGVNSTFAGENGKEGKKADPETPVESEYWAVMKMRYAERRKKGLDGVV